MRYSIKGFSLLECLIALSILAFTLLGLGRLHINAFHDFSASQQRTHAVALALDMTERIRANAGSARAGYYNQFSTQQPSTPIAGCDDNVCSPQDFTRYDLAQWRDHFSGLAKQTGSTLPGGIGMVSGDGLNFRVTVMWDSDRSGATGTGCSGNKSVDLDCFTLTTSL